MKVLLIDVNCKNSSTGKIVYDLYTYINKTDDAAVCYGRGEKIIEKNILKFGYDLETYFHAFMTRISGYTGCFSFFSTRRLLRFIKKYQPDVVHIHELHAYFVNIKLLINYLKKNHIKTIMTLHCEFAYTGKCGHSVECEKWKVECHDCPHLHDYVSTLRFDHTKYMFNQKKELLEDFKELEIVTPSKWLTERAKESFLNKHNIYTIHNGIDTEIFHYIKTNEIRKKYNINDEEKIVLALAPNLMSHGKGGEYIKKISKAMPHVRFILIGIDGETESIRDNQILLGRLYDKAMLAKFYSTADLFVICSERENFPTTCIEAQCCGISVCGFDTGGTKETILYKPEESCVEYENISSLIKVIENRLKNTPAKNMISEKAIKKYSNSYMCGRYIELYKG